MDHDEPFNLPVSFFALYLWKLLHRQCGFSPEFSVNMYNIYKFNKYPPSFLFLCILYVILIFNFVDIMQRK